MDSSLELTPTVDARARGGLWKSLFPLPTERSYEKKTNNLPKTSHEF
jgi:hypothetical protein